MANVVPVAYQGNTSAAVPDWLNKGDNAWQMIAATLVGMQSGPGLIILYGSIVKKKWAVNSLFMALYAFAAVLICWVTWAYKMSFGDMFTLLTSHQLNGFILRWVWWRTVPQTNCSGVFHHWVESHCDHCHLLIDKVSNLTRMSEDQLLIGDDAVHGEEAYALWGDGEKYQESKHGWYADEVLRDRSSTSVMQEV